MEITIDDSNSKVGSGIEIILGDDLSVSGNIREYTVISDDVFVPNDITTNPPKWLADTISNEVGLVADSIKNNIATLKTVASRISETSNVVMQYEDDSYSLLRSTNVVQSYDQKYFKQTRATIEGTTYDILMFNHGELTYVHVYEVNEDIGSTFKKELCLYDKYDNIYSAGGFIYTSRDNTILERWTDFLESHKILLDSFDVSTLGITRIDDFVMSDRGFFCYVLSNNYVHQYNVGENFNVSKLNQTGDQFHSSSVKANINTLVEKHVDTSFDNSIGSYGHKFYNDGYSMIIVSYMEDGTSGFTTVTLARAYDPTSYTSYTRQVLPAMYNANSRAVFTPDGLTCYITVYSDATGWLLQKLKFSSPFNPVGFTVEQSVANTIGFNTDQMELDDAGGLLVRGAYKSITRYQFEVPGDLTTLTQHSISPFSTPGDGFIMKDGGTMIYAFSGSILSIHVLTTPYNISTLTQVNSYVISGYFHYPILIPNGDIVYCLSGGAYKTLTFTGTTWVIKKGRFAPTSSALFSTFRADGKRLYIAELSSATYLTTIQEYECYIPHEVYGLTKTERKLEVGVKAVSFVFSPSGYELYVGDTSNLIHKYTLTTAYDLTTAIKSIGTVTELRSTNMGNLVIANNTLFSCASTYIVVYDLNDTFPFTAKYSRYSAIPYYGLMFNSDGSSVFIIKKTNGSTNKYYMEQYTNSDATPFSLNCLSTTVTSTVSLPSFAVSPSISLDGTTITLADGSNVYNMKVNGTLNTPRVLEYSETDADIVTITLNSTEDVIYSLDAGRDRLYQHILATDGNIASGFTTSYVDTSRTIVTPKNIYLHNDSIYFYGLVYPSIDAVASNLNAILNMNTYASEIGYIGRNIEQLLHLEANIDSVLSTTSNINTVLANVKSTTVSRQFTGILSFSGNTDPLRFVHVTFPGIVRGSGKTILINFTGYAKGVGIYDSYCLITLSTTLTSIWRENMDILGSTVGYNSSNVLTVVLNANAIPDMNISCSVESYLTDSVSLASISTPTATYLSTSVIA